MNPLAFNIEMQGPSLARAGRLQTPHGTIQTPAFMTVATKATAKGIPSVLFPQLGMQGIIANAYHLYLTPGEGIVQSSGGVGAFMDFKGPTMTDSGGFQILSLSGEKGGKILSAEVQDASEEGIRAWDENLASEHGKFAVIDEDGVTFTSHYDGSLHRFTPERSMEIQHALGADIIFAFDECTSSTRDYAYQREALARTHRWAKRCLEAHRRLSYEALKSGGAEGRGLYGIVQGGQYEDLRLESARELGAMDFDGYGIGGSFDKEDILATLELVTKVLPHEKPRHLLGIGEPEDILLGVAAGIDTFDCVLPTRNGRNGTLFTRAGKLRIGRAEYARENQAPDSTCDCFVCRAHSRSYIHHLFRSGEMLGPILASAHNIRFFTSLCEDIRSAIISERFEEFRNSFLSVYRSNQL